MCHRLWLLSESAWIFSNGRFRVCGRIPRELELFLTVDSECRRDALIMDYVLFIVLAVFNNRMSARVIVCGCILPVIGLGLFLTVDSVFVAACGWSLDFLMVDSMCRIDTLINYYVLLIDLAVFSKPMSA